MDDDLPLKNDLPLKLLPFIPCFTLISFKDGGRYDPFDEPQHVTSDDIVLAPTSDVLVLAPTSTPTSTPTSPSTSKKKTRAKVPTPNFPEKLKNMINEMNPLVVSWNDAGNGFIILNITAFKSSLRHFFRHNKYTSFQRNLHMYEFTKVLSSSHAAYTHDSFQRNKPVTGMKRKLSAKRCAKRSK